MHFKFHDAAETARLLPLAALIETLSGVLKEYGRGEIESPERLVVPCADGSGLLLSMPCQARDVVVHKLLTISASNPGRGLPSIQGQVTCFDAENGVPLFALDGPTVTARRTAAISMIGIDRLCAEPPRTVSIIGTGAQARGHVDAVLERFPDAQVRMRGASPDDEANFCAKVANSGGRVAPHPAGAVGGDVVICVTSSKTPVYDEPAERGRLVIGVGAYRLDMIEVGARTIQGSQIFVDDPVGAPGEAGDVVAAGTDWSTVTPLSVAVETPPDFGRPIFLKSVGCGAWDLAACRAARPLLGM